MLIFIFSLISFLCALSFFYLGIQTISLDRKNKVNIIFLFYCLVAGALAFFEFMARQAIHPDRGYLWVNAQAIAPLVTIAALHFVMQFTGNYKSKSGAYMRILLYLPFLVYLYFILFTDVFRVKVALMPWGFSFESYEKKTIFSLIAPVWMITLNLIAIVMSFLHFLKQKAKASRSAAFYIFIAMLLPFVTAFADKTFLRKAGNIPELMTLGTLVSAVFIAYAIFKHRLFEINPARAAENIIRIVENFIILTDNDFIVLHTNPAVCVALGTGESEIIGRKINKIFMDGFLPDYFTDSQLAWAGKKAVKSLETCLKKADGTPLYVMVSVSPITDSSGETHGFAVAAASIEERIKLEDNLLAEIARADMAIGKLAESNMKLMELDRMKKNFIAIVSHELRTPLTSIKGFLSFLSHGVGGDLSEKQREFVSTMGGNVEKLLKLINELLDFSKIDSGTFSVEKSPADLVVVARKSIMEMSSIVSKKNIKILEEFENDSLSAVFDETRISQVIINLLNNAVKYTYSNTAIYVNVRQLFDPEKVIPAELRTGIRQGAQYCLLSVRDEGPGMDPKYCQRIFEQFYQIEDPNTRKHEGVGLGLNISKNIIKAHNGFIWADSKGKDTGSVFYFVIPTGV